MTREKWKFVADGLLLVMRVFEKFLRYLRTNPLVHEIWHEPLIEAVSYQRDERILIVGRDIAGLTTSFATRFREAQVTAVEHRETSFAKARRSLGALNVDIRFNSPDQPLPDPAASFDKIISALALHELEPQQKIAFLREARRTLRRQGFLFAAEYSKAETSRETAVFKALSPAMTKSHIDGSWTNLLERTGFTRLRHISSHSVGFGRVTLVRCRKQ